MATVSIDAGVCGCVTTLIATSEDGQHVEFVCTSTCPHVAKAHAELERLDAFAEFSRKPPETEVFQTLAKHCPHTACPVGIGFLKAMEVAVGMALPRDVHITIEA